MLGTHSCRVRVHRYYCHNSWAILLSQEAQSLLFSFPKRNESLAFYPTPDSCARPEEQLQITEGKDQTTTLPSYLHPSHTPCHSQVLTKGTRMWTEQKKEGEGFWTRPPSATAGSPPGTASLLLRESPPNTGCCTGALATRRLIRQPVLGQISPEDPT